MNVPDLPGPSRGKLDAPASPLPPSQTKSKGAENEGPLSRDEMVRFLALGLRAEPGPNTLNIAGTLLDFYAAVRMADAVKPYWKALVQACEDGWVDGEHVANTYLGAQVAASVESQSRETGEG